VLRASRSLWSSGDKYRKAKASASISDSAVSLDRQDWSNWWGARLTESGLRWGTETSTTMAKNSTSTSTRSRTRPSGSFIWFHIIIHAFAPTLVDFGWPFSGKTWSMCWPWPVSNCILLQKTCHTAPCPAPCHQANQQNLSIQWWPQTPCLAHEASSPSDIMHLDARE